MKSLYYNYICIALLALLLVGCHTTKEAGKGKALTTSKAEKYKKSIMQAELPPAMTARMKLHIDAFGKELSVNGSLRMKRGEVVQLSLTMLGFEVGRLEFSPEDVLILDRYHKQYVRCRYDEIDFLRSAGIDFYALQSLFWNELFVPGKKEVDDEALKRFGVYAMNDMLLFLLTDTPRLHYGFIADKSTTRINRVEVAKAGSAASTQFVCTYADFSKFASGAFPTKLNFSLQGTGVQNSISLSLSRLSDSSDWDARTQPSSKYKQLSLEDVFGAVSKMLK